MQGMEKVFQTEWWTVRFTFSIGTGKSFSPVPYSSLHSPQLLTQPNTSVLYKLHASWTLKMKFCYLKSHDNNEPYIFQCSLLERMRWTGKKVKCTLVRAPRLRTGRTAHRGSRVSVTPWPLFTTTKDLVPIVQEAGWAPGPVWTGVENLAPPPGFNPQRLSSP
jgi:hypothetical protein